MLLLPLILTTLIIGNVKIINKYFSCIYVCYTFGYNLIVFHGILPCILKLLSKNINNEIFNLSAKKNISLLQLVDHFKLKPIILQKKLPILNYDINTDKINDYFNIKNTKHYLYKFLKTKI